MNVAAILTAVAFALIVFPVHFYNYIYVNTGQKYAGLNVGAYGINFYNMNTVKDAPNKMQINGKDKDLDLKKFNLNFYKIFNQLCLFKVIQLGDYGMQKDANAYVALAQNCLSRAIYKFIQINGNYCKLRNYTVLNAEHSEVRYYMKAVTIVNAIVLIKIFSVIIMEKINA